MNKFSWFTVLVLFLIISCEKSSNYSLQKEKILATVGDKVITTDEFILNYEFGFSTLKGGEDSKEKYLQLMINELLLAQEGYKQDVHQQESIQMAVASMQEERLIEEVFHRKVLDKVIVSEAEIKAEINKSAVSFQLKFLPAQSEPHALFLKQDVQKRGYSAVLADYSNELMTEPTTENQFLTPFMKVEEIDPVLLNEVKDLELQTISDPIFYKDQWFLMMVNNIKRHPIAPEDYENKSETYRKILYNRKAIQGGEAFVSELMTPLKVTTRRATFQELAPEFYRWFSDESPGRNMLQVINEAEKPYLKTIAKKLSEPLVTFGQESWTVEDFLEEFDPGRYQIRTEDKATFTRQFSDAIALTIRDYQLLKIAQKEGLNENSTVQRDIKKWEDKWVFQAMRGLVLDKSKFNDHKVAGFYDSNKNLFSNATLQYPKYGGMPDPVRDKVRKEYLLQQLIDYTDSLKSVYPVNIDKEKLASISVSNSTKNPNMSIQLLKQSSNRMAFPIVDPNW